MAKARLERRGKKGLWTIVLSVPGDRQRRIATRTDDRAAAERRMRQVLEEAEAGVSFDDNPRLAAWLDRWYVERCVGRLQDTTLAQYAAHANRIKALLGTVRLRDMTTAHVRRLHEHLLTKGAVNGGPLDPATVAVAHAALSSALRYAQEQALLLRNVAGLVPAPRVPYREPEWLTEAECGKLLAASPESPWRAYAALALLTGLRRGELLGLHWPDVDWDRGTLRVTRQRQRDQDGVVERGPKGERSRRTIPLPQDGLELLRSIRARQVEAAAVLGEDPPAHVFARRRTGRWEPYSPGAASEGVRHLYQRAGLPVPKRPVHALRHTVGMLLRSLGADRRLAQEQLGHASTATADLYAHVPAPELRDAMQRVARRIGGGGR